MLTLGITRLKSQFSHIVASFACSAALLAASVPATAATQIPPPEIGAKGYVLYDITTGQTLAEYNSTERLEPASLTKLMTAYLVFAAIENKQITLNQMVSISPNAWKTEGSRMFIEPNKPVSVDDLIKGMIVQSGNDATRALAELLAGDENNFAALMNQQGEKFGLTGTHFKNSTGLPDPQHYTTARDLSIVARHIIKDFPEFYKTYSIKEFTYNGIRQPNRNRLLWTDPSVDGMKTGHTDSAGFCLVSSANRKLPNGMERRLLSVVLGTSSDQARTQESLKLLNYGYQMFDTVKLYAKDQVISTTQIYKGTASEVQLGVKKDLLIDVPRGMAKQLKATIERKETLTAPIKAGTPLGTLKVTLDGEPLTDIPLVALKDVNEAGLFGRAIDSVKMWIKE